MLEVALCVFLGGSCVYGSEAISASLFLLGIVLAFIAAYAMARGRNGGAKAANRCPEPPDDMTEVFLLRHGSLIYTNFLARRQLDRISGPPNDERRLRHLLSLRFTDVDALLADHHAVDEFWLRGTLEMSERIIKPKHSQRSQPKTTLTSQARTSSSPENHATAN